MEVELNLLSYPIVVFLSMNVHFNKIENDSPKNWLDREEVVKLIWIVCRFKNSSPFLLLSLVYFVALPNRPGLIYFSHVLTHTQKYSQQAMHKKGKGVCMCWYARKKLTLFWIHVTQRPHGNWSSSSLHWYCSVSLAT